MSTLHPMNEGWTPALYDFTRRKITVRVHLSAEGAPALDAGAARFGVRLLSQPNPEDWQVEVERLISACAGDPGGAQWIDVVMRLPRKAERVDVFAAPGLVGPRYAVEVLDTAAPPRATAGRTSR